MAERRKPHSEETGSVAAVALRDCGFLSLVVLLSLILHVRGLGFYSDDWSFISTLSYASGDSVGERFRALFADENVYQRPVQALSFASMFQWFGADPLGYHVTDSVILGVAVLLFYLSLRELMLPRLAVLTVPLVYGLLPHYSTDRFWMAAFQTTLSLALYFASLYGDLRALRTGRARRWSWKFLSLVCLLGSGLAYEVAMPLFLLNMALIWWHARTHIPDLFDKGARASLMAMVGSNLIVLLIALSYKAATTVRAGGIETSYLWHLLRVIKRAALVDYVGLGIGLPYVAGKIVLYHADPAILVVGLALGSAVFAYIYRAAGQSADDTRAAGVWLTMLALSPVVYVLGYAIFITTSQFQVHMTGVANRIAMAAAVGVAMSFACGAGFVSSLLPSAWLRRSVFASAIALICVCGFLIINANARFWIAASDEQRRVLADIRGHVPPLPAGTTLILDGVCPYIGSGIVFEGSWDLAGALQMIYGDPTLRADVVTPRLTVGKERLTTTVYGTPVYYHYGENLMLYDSRHKAVHRLVDAETAEGYFADRANDSSGCAQGIEGEGVAPF